MQVRSLQLQMEYIYSYLEEEAMDISEDARAFGRITRQGSTEELSVFAAEFNILDEQLSTLIETLVMNTDANRLLVFSCSAVSTAIQLLVKRGQI